MSAPPAPDAPAADVPVLRAAVWMLGAVTSFSAMAVAGRLVSFELDTFEIMMYRSLIGLVLLAAAARMAGTLGQVTWRNPRLHLGRNILHFTAQNLWFYAITVIPLAQVFALEFTSPLWVLVLSPVFLGERLTRMRVLAALAGFIGILIVTRPSAETVNVGTLAAAAAAVGFAGTAIFTKRLTRSETLTCILFWMTLLQAVFGILCAGADGDIALPSVASVPWLVLIALGGLGAHLCLTAALSVAPAAQIMPGEFLRLPLLAVGALIEFAEPVDVFVLLGAAVIFGSNYLNLWVETRKAPLRRR